MSVDDDESGILERLAAVDGLDLAHGLVVVRNHTDKYVHLLELFLAGHGGDPGCLGRMRASGDLDGIGRMAHALRGVAGNIGATEVSAAAAALLNLMQQQGDPDEVALCAERLVGQLSVLVRSLTRALSDECGGRSK